MADMHISALEVSLTADHWSGDVTVRSAIDGRVINTGAKLYRKFNNKHLEPLSGEVGGEDGVCMLVRTCQSNIHVAQAARTRAFLDGQLLEVRRRAIEEPGYIGQELRVDLKQGETLVLEKLVSFYTSRDHAISECGPEARKAIARAEPEPATAPGHPPSEEKLPQRIGREELYEDIKNAAWCSRIYLAMAVLSTIVAAIGLRTTASQASSGRW